MSGLKVPVRERNRLRTWSLIHEAAMSLAVERGLAHATVEAIAEAADVSKRTFFNYFPAKEDAVLGIQAPMLPAEAVHEFENGEGDLFGRTVRLMTAVVRSATRQGSSPERRIELVRRFPELRARLNRHAMDAEELVRPVLAEHLALDEAREPPAAGHGPDDEVRALLMVAGSVIRFAYSRDRAISDGGTGAVDDAIETFRQVIRKTT